MLAEVEMLAAIHIHLCWIDFILKNKNEEKKEYDDSSTVYAPVLYAA
jgi:hypothetical protein